MIRLHETEWHHGVQQHHRRFTYNKNVAEIAIGENGRAMAITLELAKGKVLGIEGAAPFPADKMLSVNGQDLWRPMVANALR